MRKLKNKELNRITIEQYKNSDKNPIIIILDNIRSLNNIGSVFRTADAFFVEKIYLCGITATPPDKNIRKTALGSTESVDWEYFKTTKDAVLHLQSQNVKIISIEQVEGSTKLNNFEVLSNEKYAFVFGNEVMGVEQDIVNISDQCVEIPQFGTKHSLNISVSVGVVVWDFVSKHIKR